MPLIQEATVGLSAPLRYPLRLATGAFGGAGNPRMRVLQTRHRRIRPLLAFGRIPYKGLLILGRLADPDH
jgi:hypothetical protein